MTSPPASGSTSAEPLQREIGLWSATTLNMIDMIGVGPFITMPLIIAAMGGPQAMLGPPVSRPRLDLRLTLLRTYVDVDDAADTGP